MPPAPSALRVATYNVHACVGTDGRHDPDRVAAVIAALEPTSWRCRNSRIQQAWR